MEISEGRRLVEELAGESDVFVAVTDFLGSSSVDGSVGTKRDRLNVLKISEYALLVGPMRQGVEGLLAEDDIFTFPPVDASGEARALAQLIGAKTAKRTSDYLDPYTVQMINHIASERYRLLSTDGTSYKNMACPFSGNLSAGARNSAESAVSSALSCALALKTYGVETGRHFSLAEELEIVKASTQLFMARSMTHLRDLPVITGVIEDDSAEVYQDLARGSDLVEYNPRLGKVVLKSRLSSWQYGFGGREGTIGARRSEELDVRLGCPFSFAPKDLRKRYYGEVAGLAYRCGIWPGMDSFKGLMYSYDY